MKGLSLFYFESFRFIHAKSLVEMGADSITGHELYEFSRLPIQQFVKICTICVLSMFYENYFR
jgi:hypothetical protein